MERLIIFMSLSILGLIGYGFQVWSIRSVLQNKKTGEEDITQSLPPISILKPLKGIDDNLFDNLESICIQDYPLYEVIFSLQNYNDPAYKVVWKIKDKHPDRDITILIKRCNTGLNPKVNNLIPAYKSAKYEYILISDSNVMVNKDYLKGIVGYLKDPDVGLVTNLIQGIRGRTIGSIFENLHLNSFILGSVCFLDKYLKMPCVIGKSMLMRKKDLENIGGLESVKDVLAEDYIIGKKIHKMGKKVILSKHIIKNVNQYWSVRKFLNRHTRWGKLRWRIGGIRYISELFSNAVFMSFISVLLDPSKITLGFAALVSSIKIFGDFSVGRKIRADMNFFLYCLSPVKDLIIGLIWFVPFLSNTVVWRDNRYIIGKDSILSPCPETGIWSWKYRVVDIIKARFACFLTLLRMASAASAKQ
jgi:ceramide glucosyltransferase